MSYISDKLRYHKGTTALVGVVAVAALTAGALTSNFAFASGSQSPATPNQSTSDSTSTTAPLNEAPPAPSGAGSNGSAATPTTSSQIVNTTMSLVSAQVVRENLNDTQEEYVQFNFGYPVQSIVQQSGLTLTGYSQNSSVSSTSAQLVHGNSNDVLAAFPAGTDVQAYTMAVVGQGVVQDNSNEVNVPGSVGLGGSTVTTATGTAAPQLISVVSNPTLEQIQYTFSHNVTKAGGSAQATAAAFGFYTPDGTAVKGTSVVSSDLSEVTIQFPKTNQVQHAVMYYADAGAVKDIQGLTSVPSSTGSLSTAPGLTGVTPVGKTQFAFTFNEPVGSVDAAKFLVYAADGTQYVGSGYVQPSVDVIQVAFPQIQQFTGLVSEAAAATGAVKANDGSATPSTAGTRSVGAAGPVSGQTSGPDLVSASVNHTTGQVTLTFDKAINDNITYSPSNFEVITSSGDVQTARAFVEVSGETVVLDFNRSMADAAQYVTALTGAVQTFQGDKNPQGSVRI